MQKFIILGYTLSQHLHVAFSSGVVDNVYYLHMIFFISMVHCNTLKFCLLVTWWFFYIYVFLYFLMLTHLLGTYCSFQIVILSFILIFSYLNTYIVMLQKFIIPVVSIFFYTLSLVQCDLKLPVEWYHHYNDYSYNILCISLIYICHRYTWFLLYLQLILCTSVAILLFIYYC